MKHASALLLITFAALAGANALAQETAAPDPPAIRHELVTGLVTNPVEYRALIKQALQAHLGALGLILMRRAPDAAHAPFHADALVRLTSIHASMFPAGSATPRSRDTVWTDREGFEAASLATAELAGALASFIEQGTPVQQINAVVSLGESCEACHARFRYGAER